MMCPRLLCVAVIVVVLSVDASAQQPQPPAGNPTRDPRAIEDELHLLRERQNVLVEAAHKDVERVYFVFSAVAAFFTLFAVAVGFRTMLIERHHARLEQESTGEMKDVMRAYKENIATTNSLVSTLQGTIDYRTQVASALAKVDERIDDLDSYRKQETLLFASQMNSLNVEACNLFTQCEIHKGSRELFKREEQRLPLAAFASRFDTLDMTGETETLVSPVSLFLRALGAFNTMQYERAKELLLSAKEHALAQLETPLGQYGAWDPDQVRQRLCGLMTEASYHLGIIGYNLGTYAPARDDFRATFERNELDFRSRVYVAELMFFEDGSDPGRTEAEFDDIERQMKNLTSDQRRQMDPPWEVLHSRFKLRQGNLYLPKRLAGHEDQLAEAKLRPRAREHWTALENSERALANYFDAYDEDDQSTFVKFSLAQAMLLNASPAANRGLDPRMLFKEAFFQFREDAVLKTEPIVLALLYYSAAVSCFHAEIKAETPTFYLLQARQHLQRVPKGIRVFSPMNKINRSNRDLLSEMDLVDRVLFQ